MGLYKFSCKAAPPRLFSFLFVVLLVFSLSVGVFTSNATGQQTLTAENVSINITTGSNTYLQGDIILFKMISNTTPTGNLYLYDPTGEIFSIVKILITNWIKTDSGDYTYEMAVAGRGVGLLFQLPSDARTGTWQWNAIINNENKQQTYTGTFTVNLHIATPTPTLTLIPTLTPTPTMTSNGNEEPVWSSVINLWVLLGLFVIVLVCIFMWGIRTKHF